MITTTRAAAAGLLAVLVLATARAQSPAAESRPLEEAPGPWKTVFLDEDWKDASRDRTVPVRIWRPEQPAPAESRHAAPFPVIILSPGLGGSRSTYGYLAHHLASHGYVVVTLTHPGSDTRDFGGRIVRRVRDGLLGESAPVSRPMDLLLDSVNDAANLRNRPRDVSFALDRIAAHPVLATQADLKRVGVAGHSFGAHTAMCVGGMAVDVPDAEACSFRDPRVKAVLPMSPEGPGAMGIRKGAWDSFAVPVLFLTGTRDYGANAASAAWRRSGFEGVRGVDDYLVTIAGAGHMAFAMPGRETRELVDSLAVLFFDAYVKEDAAARARLQGFFAGKRPDCAAEFKPAAK